MPMSYAVFTEAVFQLTQLWVEVEVEEHYVEFLQHLLSHITTGTHLDEFKGEVSDKGDVTFKSSSVPTASARASPRWPAQSRSGSRGAGGRRG